MGHHDPPLTMKIPAPVRLPALLPDPTWPSHLEGAEIVAWVRTLHSSPIDFDEGDLEERLWDHAPYALRTIALDSVDAHEWALCEEQIQEYAAMESVAPPIVVDRHGSIIDGTHRVNAALRRGHTGVLAYVSQADD
jgi:hypothetical protein